MKTRQEMVYDFMLALAGNSSSQELIPSDIVENDIDDYESYELIYFIACRLADKYLRSLG